MATVTYTYVYNQVLAQQQQGLQTLKKHQPLRGSTPKEHPLLKEIPTKITEEHLVEAQNVLRRGAPRYLTAIKRAGYPHWEESWRSYVELAVYQQWQHFAPEKLLEVLQKQAKLVSRTKRNRLYRWQYSYHSHYGPNHGSIFYYLVYTCPSTGKLYISGVPSQNWPKPRAADRAQAWKFGLTLKEYDQLKVEA